MYQWAVREAPWGRGSLFAFTDVVLDRSEAYRFAVSPPEGAGWPPPEMQRPGGIVLLGFHAGDDSRLKTEGYGGHPMHVYVHRRRPGRVAAWLDAAGFTVEAEMLHRPEPDIEGGFVFAHR